MAGSSFPTSVVSSEASVAAISASPDATRAAAGVDSEARSGSGKFGNGGNGIGNQPRLTM